MTRRYLDKPNFSVTLHFHPVSVTGFHELRERLQSQDETNELQEKKLKYAALLSEISSESLLDFPFRLSLLFSFA